MMTALNLLICFPSAVLCGCFALYVSGKLLSDSTDRHRDEQTFVTAILCFAFATGGSTVAGLLSVIRPAKYDLYVYRFDALFGEPSFLLGKLALAHRWIYVSIAWVYGMLPAVAMFVIVAYIKRRLPETGTVMKAFLWNVILGFLLYWIFPVCGPRYAFQSFPNLPTHVVVRPVLLSAPPNAVPSLHFSTAAISWWFARRWRLGSTLAALFLMLTTFTVLATGEHYVFDVLVAIPYVVFVLWLAEKRFSWARSRAGWNTERF